MLRACWVVIALSACVADEVETDEVVSALETPMYTAVFRQGTGGQYVTGQSWSTFVATWQQQSSNGLRLVDLDVHGPANALVYDGVFVPGTGSYYLWAGVDATSLGQKADELVASGLYLVDVESYLDGNGARRFVGVWRPGSGTQVLHFGDTTAALNTRISNLAITGLRLATFDVYVENGISYYNSVFQTGTGDYRWIPDVTWNGLSKRWVPLSSQGWRIADLDTYSVGGIQYYSAILRPGTDAHTLVAATADFAVKAARARADGLNPSRIVFDPGGVQPPPTFAAQMVPLDLGVKGYSFAFVDSNGRISAEGGKGWARAPTETVSPSVPMTATSRVHIASMSKTITALAVMRLVEQGRIDVEQPFIQYTPFTSYSPDVAHVRVHDLLQHKSGMESGECWQDLTADMSRLVQRRLVGTPGVTDLYTNSNYCMLRVVIETVSGEHYVDYVTKHILQPLGIVGMSCKPEASSATLYYASQSDSTGAGGLDHTSDCAGFGWYSSAREFGQLAAAVIAGKVLNAQVTRMMFDNQYGYRSIAPTMRGTAYGHDGIWSDGGGRGLITTHLGGPHGMTLVLLINTYIPSFNISWMSRGFSDVLTGNVSQGRTATQSTTDGAHHPQLAVDGNLWGDANDNQFSSTLTSIDPWWRVDVGPSQIIGDVVVWQRVDVTPARMRIELSHDGATWTPYADVTSFLATSTFRPRSSARYVRVRPMTSSAVSLQLAEVKVFTY